MKLIVTAVVIIGVLVIAYFTSIQNPEKNETQPAFQNPIGPPFTRGPDGPPPQ